MSLLSRAKTALYDARAYEADWLEARTEDYIKPAIINRSCAILEVSPTRIEKLRLIDTPDLHTSQWKFECDGLSFLVKFKWFGRVGQKAEELKVGEFYLYLLKQTIVNRVFGGQLLEESIVRDREYGGYIHNLVDLGARIEQAGL